MFIKTHNLQPHANLTFIAAIKPAANIFSILAQNPFTFNSFIKTTPKPATHPPKTPILV